LARGSTRATKDALFRHRGRESDGRFYPRIRWKITVEGVHQLFRSPFLTGRIHTVFDVGPKDGQRFIGSAAPDTSTLRLNVITNWTAELKKK